MPAKRTSTQKRRINVSSDTFFFATKQLKRLALTNQQLVQCHFSTRHMPSAFNEWPLTWDPSISPTIEMAILPHLRPFLTHRWVTSEASAGDPHLSDAWMELQLLQIEPDLRLAIRLREQQQAKNKRPQRRNYILSLEKTITIVVQEFCDLRENQQENDRDLWSRFYAHLEELDLDPRENDGQYEYNIGGDKRRLISLSQFQRLVRKARKVGVN